MSGHSGKEAAVTPKLTTAGLNPAGRIAMPILGLLVRRVREAARAAGVGQGRRGGHAQPGRRILHTAT